MHKESLGHRRRPLSVSHFTMTAATDTSRHESVGGRDGDSVRTIPVRNPINVESLSSWIVNNDSPLLQSIIFGSAGRSNDGQWLQERMQVKQFGKLAVIHDSTFPS